MGATTDWYCFCRRRRRSRRLEGRGVDFTVDATADADGDTPGAAVALIAICVLNSERQGARAHAEGVRECVSSIKLVA